MQSMTSIGPHHEFSRTGGKKEDVLRMARWV